MTKLEQAIAYFEDAIYETISKQDGPFMAVLITRQHVQGGKEICAFCLYDDDCLPGETICGASYKGFRWRGLEIYKAIGGKEDEKTD